LVPPILELNTAIVKAMYLEKPKHLIIWNELNTSYCRSTAGALLLA
jgi:hypothetical protein